MKRQHIETYLNHITAFEGNVDVYTNVRLEDNTKLYLCDKYANVNADILTAFYCPNDIEIEIILTQNVVDLQPTNERCRFSQTIMANTRTIPICGPIILCANGFTAIYIKSDHKSLMSLKCYGLSLDNDQAVRILKRHTIIAKTAIPNVVMEYKKGFIIAHDDANHTEKKHERFIIIPDPYYEQGTG